MSKRNLKQARNHDGSFKDPEVESFYQDTNKGSQWNFVKGLPMGLLTRDEWIARLNLGAQLGML